jgi:hypothetical protein
MMEKLEQQISVLIYKLEKIISFGFMWNTIFHR